MSRLDDAIALQTQSLDLMHRVYADSFPDPRSLASKLGAADVEEVLKRIALTAIERRDAANTEDVDYDDQDDYWRVMNRFAGLLPYLARRHPSAVTAGLCHPQPEVRLFVAIALEKVPFRAASPEISSALSTETDELNVKALQDALLACTSVLRCAAERFNSVFSRPVRWEE